MLSKDGKLFPCALIDIEDANIVKGDTARSFIDLIVTSTIDHKKLLICSFNVEMDHGGT